MQQLEHVWINGEFTVAQGETYFDLYNPSSAEVTGRIRLANTEDALRAIAAAKAAFVHWSQTRVDERLAVLQRMRDAMAACQDELLRAIIQEYGAPASRSAWMASYPVAVIDQVMQDLREFAFITTVGKAQVKMTPLGLPGLSPRGTAMPVLSAASWPPRWPPDARR